jgi:large subunit ribosomal protein L25
VRTSTLLFSTSAATESSCSLEVDVIDLKTRDNNQGSRASRRLRKKGYLPGILYGEDSSGDSTKVLVALKTRSFEKLHRKLWTSIENQVFHIHVEGGSPIKAYMRDVQFDPGDFSFFLFLILTDLHFFFLVTDTPLSVNFMRYKPGCKISIPITYLNEEGSPGLKRGGYINHIHHELECICETDQLPTSLQIDVNGLHVGDKIRLESIKFPVGVRPVIPAGSLVSKIAGRRGLIPRAEVVVAVEEEVIEQAQEDFNEELDEWNDVF